MKRIEIIVVSIVLMFSKCSTNEQIRYKGIKWKKIYELKGSIDFGRMEKLGDKELLIFYSYPMVNGGGLKVVKLNLEKDSFDILLESPNNYISYANLNDHIAGAVIDDFRDNTLHSSLLVSRDSGLNWNEMPTPLKGLRTFFFINNTWIVEGDLNGTGQIYKTSDSGKNWEKINTLKLGLKSLYLVGYSDKKNKVYCIGSTEFNEKDSKFYLLNYETSSLEEIAKIESINSYLKPISENNDLYAFKNGKSIRMYSFRNNEMIPENEFKIPKGAVSLENLFINDNLYLLSASVGEKKDSTVTWISYNNGNDWQLYQEIDAPKLVYNSFGKLILSNSTDILIGEIQ